jgi:hypothetical protein
VAELRTPHGALEHGQLLTECQILERDRSVSTADQRERSKRDDKRSQHELSCPAISHRINRGRRSDSGERHPSAVDAFILREHALAVSEAQHERLLSEGWTARGLVRGLRHPDDFLGNETGADTGVA